MALEIKKETAEVAEEQPPAITAESPSSGNENGDDNSLTSKNVQAKTNENFTQADVFVCHENVLEIF